MERPEAGCASSSSIAFLEALLDEELSSFREQRLIVLGCWCRQPMVSFSVVSKMGTTLPLQINSWRTQFDAGQGIIPTSTLIRQKFFSRNNDGSKSHFGLRGRSPGLGRTNEIRRAGLTYQDLSAQDAVK
jgi:hypothetical protein